MVTEEMAKSGTSQYYDAWEKFTKAAVGDCEEEEGEAAQASAAPVVGAGYPSYVGYDFRKGHKTSFPEIAQGEGESDESAAFRVAGERRTSGVDAFRDGSVCGAQTAVDAWGQGLLALERLRNLRKRRRAAEELAAEEEGASPPADGDEPSDDDVHSLALTLRLNIAQALLKLRQYEQCVRHCDAALQLDPRSAKALWRKAKAVWEIRNPGMAREALERLLEVDEGNPAAVSLLREIQAEEERIKLRRRGAPAPKRAHRPAPAPAPAASAPAAAAPAATPAAAAAAPAAASGGGAGVRAPWACCRRRRGEKEL